MRVCVCVCVCVASVINVAETVRMHTRVRGICKDKSKKKNAKETIDLMMTVRCWVNAGERRKTPEKGQQKGRNDKAMRGEESTRGEGGRKTEKVRGRKEAIEEGRKKN